MVVEPGEKKLVQHNVCTTLWTETCKNQVYNIYK